MSRRPPRSCLLIDCLGFPPYIREMYESYANALAGVCDVVALVHRPGRMWMAEPDVPAIVLSDDDIFRSFAHRKDMPASVQLGNNDLKLIAGVRRMPDYELFLKLEDDVLCTRDLRESISVMLEAAQTCDLLTSFMTPYAPQPQWDWWESIQPPEGIAFDLESQGWRSFHPLMAVSRAFFEHYANRLEQGWIGHYEVLMPTLARRDGFTVKDAAHTLTPLTQYPQFGAISVAGLDMSVPLFIHPVKGRDTAIRMRELLAAHWSGV